MSEALLRGLLAAIFWTMLIFVGTAAATGWYVHGFTSDCANQSGTVDFDGTTVWCRY